MTDPIDNTAEDYIRSLNWSAEAKDYEKTLVAGNIRGFYAWLRANDVTLQGARRGQSVALNFAQVQQVVDCFGGETDPETEVTIGWFAKSTCQETGTVMEAGYYLHFTEYPEEGRFYLDADAQGPGQ